MPWVVSDRVERPRRYETINPNWTTEEDGKIEGHAFDPCGVPEKLQFRVWDRISDKERRALGFALIRRKRLWDVCTTKNRTVGLQVIGRIGGTEIQATGELWVELSGSRGPSTLRSILIAHQINGGRRHLKNRDRRHPFLRMKVKPRK